MISLAFGLTLATYASAQAVSMVPNPNLAASGSASASGSYPASAPPAATSSSGYGSSGYGSPNQYGQYGSSSSYNQYTAASAQYTPPPQSEVMPYSSFMNGGYQSMSCGYGYVKGYDGSCTSTESWVRTLTS